MSGKNHTVPEGALRHGAVGVIVKPFDPMVLSDQSTNLWNPGKAA